MNLYIGNITREVTESDLRELFEPFGKVDAVTVARDKSSGVSRGFAFVEMRVREEAQAAIAALYRKPFKGQSLDITESRPREARRSGPRGNRGRRSR
jgi:RNA recognition motif-containing protein